MSRTFVVRRTLAEVAALVVVLVAFAVAAAGPAMAADSTVTAEIRSGADGILVGSADFRRTVASDGSDTLTLVMSVPGGISESQVCLSPDAFTSKASPGQCPFSQGKTGTTASYTIPLDATYAGRTVHVQAHVVTKGNTAYAGWQPGFFGEVAVPAPGGTPVPAGTVGGVGLAVLASVFAFMTFRRRRVGAVR